MSTAAAPEGTFQRHVSSVVVSTNRLCFQLLLRHRCLMIVRSYLLLSVCMYVGVWVRGCASMLDDALCTFCLPLCVYFKLYSPMKVHNSEQLKIFSKCANNYQIQTPVDLVNIYFCIEAILNQLKIASNSVLYFDERIKIKCVRVHLKYH